MKQSIIKPNYIILLITLFLSGCGALSYNPIANELKETSPLQDAKKYIVVSEGMSFINSALGVSMATRGVAFPPGKYILEAEDSRYYYYKAPLPVEYRIYNYGKIVDNKYMDGGLMVCKSWTDPVQGGAYTNVEENKKMLLFKLGGEFTSAKDRKWKQSF